MNAITTGWKSTSNESIQLLWEDGVPARVSVTGAVPCADVEAVLAELGWSATGLSDHRWSTGEGDDECVQSLVAARIESFATTYARRYNTGDVDALTEAVEIGEAAQDWAEGSTRVEFADESAAVFAGPSALVERRAIRLTLSNEVSGYGPYVDAAQMAALQDAIVAELDRRGYDVERFADDAEDAWLVLDDGEWTDAVELRQDVYDAVC